MRSGLLVKLIAGSVLTMAMAAASTMTRAQSGAAILKPAEAGRLVPSAVFYRGQTATTQLRNSGGVKFDDGYYVLASLVDTAGYSSTIVAKYQAYFITEVPIKIGGQDLAAGVYGIGFVGGDKFVVTDVGGHDVLSVSAASDAELKRPVPLAFVANDGGGYRLYAGRQYVVITR